jgi:hypothetical protein
LSLLSATDEKSQLNQERGKIAADRDETGAGVAALKEQIQALTLSCVFALSPVVLGADFSVCSNMQKDEEIKAGKLALLKARKQPVKPGTRVKPSIALSPPTNQSHSSSVRLSLAPRSSLKNPRRPKLETARMPSLLPRLTRATCLNLRCLRLPLTRSLMCA